MTRDIRLHLAAAAALVFSVAGEMNFPCTRENAFFPTQAVEIVDNESSDMLTVINDDDEIELSFITVEFIKKLIKMYDNLNI